jgi:DNA-binding response OmpR family regulator
MTPALIRLGELEFDADRLTVRDGGLPVKLTSRELLVLKYLLTRQGRIVTREQLLTNVWHNSYTGDDRTVDVHVSRLRKKLPSLRGRLQALKNIGYRLEAAAQSRAVNE